MALNIQNLKPVSSKEEARERGRAGGIASGKARAALKSLKELVIEDASFNVKCKKSLDKLIEAGNISAIELGLKLKGEMPREQKEVIVNNGAEIFADYVNGILKGGNSNG